MCNLSHYVNAPRKVFTLFFGALILTSLFFPACKSKPVTTVSPEITVPVAVGPNVSAALDFTGINAGDPAHLDLQFALEIMNAENRRVKVEGWRAEINEQRVGSSLGLVTGGNDITGMEIKTSNFTSVPLTLNMDMAALSSEGLPYADSYNVKLTTELLFFDKSETSSDTPLKVEVFCFAEFPGVKAPDFSITSIAIIKAELINTRFRVNMKIDNPNPFPMNLSAFGYELYGNGRLWADGNERNVFTVPAKSSMTAQLYLLMNFIGMERSLLNQIINLVDVNYRFAGNVQVATGVEYLPVFKTGFDLSGHSKVLEN